MSESPEANLPLPLSISPWRNARRHTLPRLRRLVERNPQWGLRVVAACAWVFLAAAPQAHAAHGGTHRDVWRDSLMLAAMVVAMMLPLTIDRVRELARSIRWRHRHRAVAAFLSGYLAVWMLAMLSIDAGWRFAVSRTEWRLAAAAATVAAVLWELAWRCWLQPARDDPTRSHERRKSAKPAHLGVVAAGGCVASCWALMVACVAFAHSLPVMIALFCVQFVGRHRPATSPAVTALAVLGVCGAALVRMAGHHAM